MNYAMFGEWVKDRVEDLVQFGVPRGEAVSMMQVTECAAVNAEARQRGEAQFLLDFKREGAGNMAKRYGKSRQAMWQKRRKILGKAIAPHSIAPKLTTEG